MSEIAKATLHVFTSGDEWFVAASAEDAAEIAREDHGHEHGDECGGDAEDFTQLPDEKRLSIIGWEPAKDETDTMKACGEWVVLNGRGFLCSMEF